MKCCYWQRVVFVLLVVQVKPFHFFRGKFATNENSFVFVPSKRSINFTFRNGYHCPATYNPADFLIGTLSKNNNDGDSIAQQLCDAFEVCRQDKQMKTIDTFVIIEDDIEYDIRKPLWIYTVFWLIQRNFSIVTRDPTIQKLQIVQKIVSVIFFRFSLLNAINVT